MASNIIEVNNISKKYSFGTGNSTTLRESLMNKWYNLFNKETELNEFWALDNISFELKTGDVLGIVGKNGAGKSTILKVLSRITPPTKGTINIYGKVSSLLEVGTGFHPELTGKENIFLNGSLLGMTKNEINRKLDEIIDFSGVEKFIDTPVKRYSSGMYVRLAFAVAAHLEPEILIIDEVLAVGDAEFQKKCLGKMGDISKDGRTVIFVSHNMNAVKSLCNKAILLEKGQLTHQGTAHDIVNKYLQKSGSSLLKKQWSSENKPCNKSIQVNKVEIIPYYLDNNSLDVRTPFDVIIEFEYLDTKEIPLHVSLHLCSMSGEIIFDIGSDTKTLRKGTIISTLKIPGNFLNDGSYYINYLIFNSNGPKLLFQLNECLKFEIKDFRSEDIQWYGEWNGAIRPTMLPFNIEANHD